MTQQLLYKFHDGNGDVEGSFWSMGAASGTVVVVVGRKFVVIRRSRVADKRKGIKAEWTVA